MKSAAIFYFTGTGNTQEVLAMIKSAFYAEGIKTDCLRIDHCTISNNTLGVANYDAIGIGYPILAYNAPETVERFLMTLPPSDGKRAFIFKTSGEPFFINGASSFGISRILKKKGYVLNYERHFIMPYNIFFRYPDAVVKQLYTLAERLSIKLAQDIADGVSDPPEFNPIVVLVSLIMRIQRPLAKLNGRMYGTDAACNLCRKCVRECRVGNIRLDAGKIKFGWKCMMCMRCVMYCPQGALKAGLINVMALRGPYDFKRITEDPDVCGEAIQDCNKGFFKFFKKYVKEMEELTSGSASNDSCK